LNNPSELGGSDAKESSVREFRVRLAEAKNLGDVYEIVKDTVKRWLDRYRVGLMVYLDDLPLQLGAYHLLGSNAIVVNRALLQIVESTAKSRNVINAFIYTILLHEYLTRARDSIRNRWRSRFEDISLREKTRMPESPLGVTMVACENIVDN
jgi:hypothetical protein